MSSSRAHSLRFIVTVAGLGYFILFASAQIVADWISGSVPFYDYIHIPFIILFGLSIVATWVRPKVGYIMGLISSVAGIAVLSPFTFVKGVSSPANFGLFFYVITIFPMMLAAVLYSLMAYLDLRNPNRRHSDPVGPDTLLAVMDNLQHGQTLSTRSS